MRVLFQAALTVIYLFSYMTHASVESNFLRLAEGFTSQDSRTGIQASQRMFSVPALNELCMTLESPAYLQVESAEPVSLVRGEWFPYDKLAVVAVDASGRVLPKVPIVIEVEDVVPAVLNLRSDMTAEPGGKVLAIRTGHFSFRFRTICASPPVMTVAKAEVVEH